MSDPVTNVEIEDVLSSIRRLVSNEERRTDDEAPDDESETGKAGEKLVLTPAQRVDESRASDAPETDTPETDAVEYEVHAPGRRGDAHRYDGVEDAEIVEAPETDRADDAAAGPGDATDDADEAGTASTPAGHDPEAAEDAPQSASKEDIDLKELEARIAGFEAAVAEQDDEWEPDGSGDDELVSDPVTPLPWQHEEEQDASPDDDDAGDAATDEVADARADDARAAGPDARARPEQDGHEEAGEWFADDAYLDEEALRDMVSEIVRQELQGELGERITRNVRKLVRREIHRALLSQGME